MRVLIVCPCPPVPELGAAQVHLNLADALRDLGHSVLVWSPAQEEQAHWTQGVRQMRARLAAFLRSNDAFDLVDCPPSLLSAHPVIPGVTWLARGTQPDMLYLMDALRERSLKTPGDLARTTVASLWTASVYWMVYRGWSTANLIMCHTSRERRWIGEMFPWFRAKIRTFDGAISDPERAQLARVRDARRHRAPAEPVRYLWIGRWVPHKGTETLLRFLTERLAGSANEEFTVAGCGEVGAQALAPLLPLRRLHVVPYFARDELPGLLARHDAGLFTSRVEGWGLSLNEMVEAGLPVYATAAGGVDEIRSVLGSFIPTFPPPPAARPPPAPSDQARSRYEARFCWRAVAERYVDSLGGAR